MPHVDPETLALAALGEPVTSEAEERHLTDCAECAAALAEFTATAAIGRTAGESGSLLTPPARVWEGIAKELGLAGPASALPESGEPRPLRDVATVPEVAPRDGSADPATVSLDERRRRRLLVVGLVSAAAALAAGVVGVNLLQSSLRTPQAEVLADAELEAFPEWPDAAGEAVLEELPNGSLRVTVTLDAAAGGQGSFREVWLIRSDASDLVSLGELNGTSGTFEVPAGVDVDEFNLVDVSEEPRDGNPGHSGDSIVRGPLA